MRLWEDAAALTRLIERNPAMSCAAEVSGRLVGTMLCGHDGLRGWLRHVAANPAWPRFWSAAGWRQREDLSLVSLGLGAATPN